MTRRSYYFDAKTQRMVEGYPPQPERHAQAPFVIQDTIRPYYHPGAGMWVESRSMLNRVDEATGCITTDKLLPPDPSRQRARQKEIDEDIKASVHRTIEAIDSGHRQFTEEEKAFHKEQNELMSQKYGFDAFNVVGKKAKKKKK